MKHCQKIICGVAGVGYLGKHHARIYSALPSCQLAGVYDIDEERANEIAQKLHCPVFKSIEELGQVCDAVSVVVPTHSHCEIALKLLQTGCHLLIEKPLCSNIIQAEQIFTAAKRANRIVQVGHIEHFNPVMSFLEKTVQCPEFIVAERLAPFNIRGTEVGVVLDLMIHDIGIILALVREPIKKIESVGVKVLSQTEDIANARLTFENGCVVNMNTSRVSEKKVREIRLFQPNMYLSLDFINQEGHIIKKNDSGLEKKSIPLEKGDPLTLELVSFIDCITRYKEPKVGTLLGKTALEVAISITEQIAQEK
jgi:predicted dehydrogenase